jgi:hypothetical protein
MDARRNPYWPAPGRPTGRFLDLVERGILLDHIWKGSQASYRVVHQGRVRTWSWATIKKEID